MTRSISPMNLPVRGFELRKHSGGLNSSGCGFKPGAGDLCPVSLSLQMLRMMPILGPNYPYIALLRGGGGVV